VVERATVNETTQIGVETTEGTAVAADKFLPSLTIDISPNTTSNEQTTQGVKLPTIHQPAFEYSDVKLASNGPTYDEIVYPLSSILKTPVIATIDTSGKTWTFAPSGTAPDTVKTFTAEQGSAVRAAKVAGIRITEFGLDWSRDALTMSGSGLGRTLTDGITLTATPTSLAQIVMQPKDISIFADPDDPGDLGTTKLLRALKGSLKIGNRFGGVKANDKAQTSFVAMVELPIKGTLDLTLEANAAGMAFLTNYRAGQRMFVRVDVADDRLAGAASANYELVIDLACDIAKINPYTDDQGVRCIPVSFSLVYDAGWGKWINAVVTNKLAAL
jgi:hypothetical protein